MSRDLAISASGVVKRYGDRTVLGGVGFDVPRGQVLAIVGPSGGGKSTLLRCMTGLVPFDGGSIVLASAKLVGGASDAAQLAVLRRKTGLVFQQWHLFPHRSALENVMEAPVHVRRVPVAKARVQAAALLESVGLGHRLDAMPRDLSGGEQQRCAIARALAMEPEILFLDEPTSALDPRRVQELGELLTALRRDRDLTLVVVTHEMGFAAKVAERVLVLCEGAVIEDGTPAEVLASPRDPRTRQFLGLEIDPPGGDPNGAPRDGSQT